MEVYHQNSKIPLYMQLLAVELSQQSDLNRMININLPFIAFFFLQTLPELLYIEILKVHGKIIETRFQINLSWYNLLSLCMIGCFICQIQIYFWEVLLFSRILGLFFSLCLISIIVFELVSLKAFFIKLLNFCFIRKFSINLKLIL